MTALSLEVNGGSVREDVEPRTHLADFLRETLLLTGTHLGCEHGVCGACTVLLDGEPVRGCITLAGMCEGRSVCTIEGLADDPVMVALRAAFTAKHALQCGYCTPGMLVTARDIVRRLPDADDDRIRLELAGNLCRCTGYNGIVRAIRQVLDAPPEVSFIAPASLPAARVPDAIAASPARRPPPVAIPAGNGLSQSLTVGLSVEQVWDAIQDPALVASCVPGVTVTEAGADRVAGELRAAMGPIRARFAGDASITFDPPTRSGQITGQGRDATSNTRLSTQANFTVTADGPTRTLISLDVTYALQGPLAQFSRGPVVRVFAAELAAAVAANLEARLRGEAAPPAVPLAAGTMMLRAIWHALAGFWRRPNG